MKDTDKITLTELGKRFHKNEQKLSDLMTASLTAEEHDDWQKLERIDIRNHSSYDIDRFLLYMQKAGLIKILPAEGSP